LKIDNSFKVQDRGRGRPMDGSDLFVSNQANHLKLYHVFQLLKSCIVSKWVESDMNSGRMAKTLLGKVLQEK
jgi:hypothetical protein